MNTKIIYIESKSVFSKKEKIQIGKSVGLVYRDVAKALGAHMPVNFTFYRFGKNLKGFAQAKDWITLTLSKAKISQIDLDTDWGSISSMRLRNVTHTTHIRIW